MALTDYLTFTNFLASTNGLTNSDVDSQYVNLILKKLNQALVKKLGIVANSSKPYYRKNSARIILVDAWQKNGVVGDNPSNLVVKRGKDGSETLTTLTEGRDFRFITSSEDFFDNIVIAIKLYSNYLEGEGEYIKLEGERGLFDDLPDELATLDLDLYALVKRAVFSSSNENATGGRGDVQSTKMGDVSVTFGGSGSGEARKMDIKEVILSANQLLDNVYSTYTDYQNFAGSIIG